VIKKLATIFVLSVMTLVPLRSSFAGKDCGPERGTREFKLGDLKLYITETSPEGDYSLQFSTGEQVLITGECAFKTHEPKAFRNVPFPNCRTLMTYCFSGGAHCCTTLFIATECGSGRSLDMVDLAHSNGKVRLAGADGARGKMIKVHDWQFAYYGTEDSPTQISFADSPAMTRLLVFDNGHWRPDRIGEFSRFYSHLLRRTIREVHISDHRKHDPDLTASLAIKAAYYSLMSGKPVEKAAEILSRLSPVEWRRQSGKIIQDVHRAVSEFNPVEVIR
jgi:hypothetical protein